MFFCNLEHNSKNPPQKGGKNNKPRTAKERFHYITEPLIRLNLEADTPELMQAKLQEVLALILSRILEGDSS